MNFINENREQASGMLVNLMSANADQLNNETKLTILHLALMIEFGGWSDQLIVRCYQPDTEWGPTSQLSIDVMLSYKAWLEEGQNENGDDETSEFLRAHDENIRQLFQAYKSDEFEIASSIDWSFVGRLFIGAVETLCCDKPREIVDAN